jgi:hypothetical protein
VSFIRSRALRAAVGAACATALFPVPSALAANVKGPSSSTAPYVQGVAPGVDITSVLTVGDSAKNGYKMVGIPDGMGFRIDNATGRADVWLNHELGAGAGAVRAHGQTGAFVSKWQINADKRVYAGADLVQTVSFWDYVTQGYGATPSTGGANPRNAADTFPAQDARFGRFCSGSLATPALLKGKNGRGYNGNIWFGNEEVGDEGRLFGITDDGTAKQLPRLGLWSWENVRVAKTGTNDTVAVGGEDGPSDGSQLWIYSGRKQRTGDAFRRAGLTTGVSSVLDLEQKSVTNDVTFRQQIGKGVPARFQLNEIDWDQSGARQNAEAKADGLSLNRIEDVHFDPNDPNVLYFATTGGGGTAPNPADPGVSRDGGGIWKVTFDDISDASEGGTIELLLDGSEAPYLNKPDNIVVDKAGNLLIQEDPGNNAHLARIVAYNTHTGARAVLAQFDPSLFRGAGAITQDEESSGIESTGSFFGPNSFIFDAQVHAPSGDPATVEKGQILTMKVANWDAVYTPAS